MIKLLSLLVNVSGHSWACLANIAILMQNAELCFILDLSITCFLILVGVELPLCL